MNSARPAHRLLSSREKKMSFTALTVKEVHSGVIHKVGGKVKSWHKRWMILRTDHTLQYYKDASKGSLGSITLSDPKFEIRTGAPGDTSWPKNCNLENSLVIITTGRVYYMYTDSQKEAEDWIRIIRDSKDLAFEASQ